VNEGTILRYFLKIKLDSFWLITKAEKEKLLKITLFSSKNDLYTYLKTENSGIMQLSPLLRRLEKDLLSYGQGKKINFISYPLKLDNYPLFFIKIWALTREIPYGEVRSYKWLAEKAHTKGYRAVGSALAHNPFPIIIPCHRIIKQNGSLGGYSAGSELKKKLLRVEGITSCLSG